VTQVKFPPILSILFISTRIKKGSGKNKNLNKNEHYLHIKNENEETKK